MSHIGNVVVGFYVAYDSPPGHRIAKENPKLNKKQALAEWAKNNGLTFCQEYLEGHPTHGAFMGYKLYAMEDKPHPWFMVVDEVQANVKDAETKLKQVLQQNSKVFEGDEHARPEFLIDQHRVRSAGQTKFDD